jgi:DNA-binding CsgD family transcriptional regulator
VGDHGLVLKVLTSIYDAALDPHLWPQALRELAAATGGDKGAIVMHDFRAAHGSIAVNLEIDPSWQRRYDDYYCTKNVWASESVKRPPGLAFTSEELVCSQDLVKTEFYNDFLQPQGVFFQLAAGLFKDERVAGGIAITRPRSRGPFLESDVDFLRTVVPHLRRAFQIHRRIAGAELKRSALAGAIDRLAIGVILVDRDGRLLLVNRAAESILASNDGLRAHSGTLSAIHPGESALLRALVHAATAEGVGLACGGALSISRPSLRRPVSILVAPLRLEDDVFLRHESPVAALFVSDPEQGIETAPELLSRLYGLTAAEARLATLLVAGQKLADAADRLGVTVQTARTQLKRIFQKTDVRGQSELIRLLVRGAGALAQA